MMLVAPARPSLLAHCVRVSVMPSSVSRPGAGPYRPTLTLGGFGAGLGGRSAAAAARRARSRSRALASLDFHGPEFA
jgi:hypothetical protein